MPVDTTYIGWWWSTRHREVVCWGLIRPISIRSWRMFWGGAIILSCRCWDGMHTSFCSGWPYVMWWLMWPILAWQIQMFGWRLLGRWSEKALLLGGWRHVRDLGGVWWAPLPCFSRHDAIFSLWQICCGYLHERLSWRQVRKMFVRQDLQIFLDRECSHEVDRVMVQERCIVLWGPVLECGEYLRNPWYGSG